MGNTCSTIRGQTPEEIEDRFANLTEDILVLITGFAAYGNPESLTRLKHINKHWHQSLDPNRLDVNMIWENNICRVVFENIPKSLKMRRWDRYFQYRWYIIKQNNHGASPRWCSADDLYQTHQIIEGCDYDIEAINSYHSSNNNNNHPSDKKNGLFIDKVDTKSGLPEGFKWKLKCPAVGINLQSRGWNKYYCKVCKKKVYHVENAQQMREKVNNGQCVRYFVAKEMYIVQYDGFLG